MCEQRIFWIRITAFIKEISYKYLIYRRKHYEVLRFQGIYHLHKAKKWQQTHC